MGVQRDRESEFLELAAQFRVAVNFLVGYALLLVMTVLCVLFGASEGITVSDPRLSVALNAVVMLMPAAGYCNWECGRLHKKLKPIMEDTRFSRKVAPDARKP